MNETKYEYEYAVQWRYAGESEWYTASQRYPNMKEAVLSCNAIHTDSPLLVLRIVRRTVTEWEEVK